MSNIDSKNISSERDWLSNDKTSTDSISTEVYLWEKMEDSPELLDISLKFSSGYESVLISLSQAEDRNTKSYEKSYRDSQHTLQLIRSHLTKIEEAIETFHARHIEK